MSRGRNGGHFPSIQLKRNLTVKKEDPILYIKNKQTHKQKHMPITKVWHLGLLVSQPERNQREIGDRFNLQIF